MKKLRLLLTMIIVLAAVSVQAQNTGKLPFVGSTHTYTIIKGTVGTTTLAWDVVGGASEGLSGDYIFVDGAGLEITGPTGTSVNIKWLKPGGEWNVQVSETRVFTAPELAAGAPTSGCPTIRQIPVTVGANNFDVYADLITTQNACAFVNAPVEDIDTSGVGTDLGNNSDDDFGLTTREFLITAENATGAWDYTYTLTHKNGADALEDVGDLSVKIGATDISLTGETISVGAGIATNTITVSYTTNADRQDKDFDLVFTIIGATDSLGTSDGDANGGKTDDATYTVYAVPATTGITTD